MKLSLNFFKFAFFYSYLVKKEGIFHVKGHLEFFKSVQKCHNYDSFYRSPFCLDNIFYWPKEKITKGDLIKYYDAIAPYLLPYLKDRPESLRRYPNGITGQTFFQKNLVNHPDWVTTAALKHKEGTVNYLLIQNEESLLFAANMGCIELHPFFSRTSALHNPDYLVIDLDPKGASFEKVIQVAQTVHEVLEELQVPSYCKTSGATGLHIAIPLGAKYDYAQVKAFAEIIALLVHRRIPKISTLERSLSKRQNKVYIDVYQNNFGQTIAAPYSVRARPARRRPNALSRNHRWLP